MWAPNAKSVSVVGDFNDWDPNKNLMKKINNEGVWHLFVTDLEEGLRYKYSILSQDNEYNLKSDPYAYCSELRPGTASVVYDLEGYKWKDRRWRREQKKKDWNVSPLNVYEMHLSSWKKKNFDENQSNPEDINADTFYNYSEIADMLIPYLKERQFSHVEIMPIIERPFDRSWGYQGTGYYSVTSRHGTPHDFMKFVDKLHLHSIGVILDWVPGHFCKDAHGLYFFDGTPTYEYNDLPVRENEGWGTANFNFGKKEVVSYLISNALFWLEHFHIDGFRIDAVANMIYWNTGDLDKSSRNELAISFLQKLNDAIKEFHPEALTFAEDSTDFLGVTSPTSVGGLGFDFKWNMGWMNDVLSYMEADESQRGHLHNKITFPMMYNYSENYVLPLSHDEVVHGKKSLLNKMPGDYWKKFANLRLLLGFLYSHPGKKLLFMGAEFGQYDEWKDFSELDWSLLDYESHSKMDEFTNDLFNFYKRSKPFWQQDFHQNGFNWIDVDNKEQSIFSFARFANDNNDHLVAIFNFTSKTYHNYKVGVPQDDVYREVFNSDEVKYGGSGQINNGFGRPSKFYLNAVKEPYHNQQYHVELTIPPLGFTILRPLQKKQK